MANAAKSGNDGLPTVIPHMVVKGASEAIEFYKNVFGATETMRMPAPNGKVMHCSLRLGNSILHVCDEFSQNPVKSPNTLGGSSFVIHLNVEDADATFARALAAGATTLMPLANVPWGARYGQIVDPFGHIWAVSTHVEDVTPEEVAKRMGNFAPPKPS